MSIKKLIKTEEEYENACSRLMFLLDLDSVEGSPEDDELELLTLLIEKYESQEFPIEKPDPVSAIKFRMEQQGLKQKDLIPFIGARSKVSEVLNNKIQLSLNMIRKLNAGLDIPLDVLISKPEQNHIFSNTLFDDIPPNKFPLTEMYNKGYFKDFTGTVNELKTYAEEKLHSFMGDYACKSGLQPAMMRTTAHSKNNDKEVNPYALWAWQIKVLKAADEQKLNTNYQKGVVNDAFMKSTIQLSWSEQGPNLAKEYLAKHGIHLVIEPHLEKTYLDGAVCINEQGNPVIAMTLRHKRIDNFWFTLLHELAHIQLHLDGTSDWFIDNHEAESCDPREDEANSKASEMLIAQKDWNLDKNSTLKEMKALATKLNIHPAIVIGRCAREFNSWASLRRHIKDVELV